MDRPDVEEQETEEQQQEPITLDIQDGLVGGSSDFTEGNDN